MTKLNTAQKMYQKAADFRNSLEYNWQTAYELISEAAGKGEMMVKLSTLRFTCGISALVDRLRKEGFIVVYYETGLLEVTWARR